MSVSTTARILARRSLRKAKGQFAITGLLVAITAMMLHLAVILTGYRESISETTERLDTEDTSILLSSAEGAKRAAHVLDSDRRSPTMRSSPSPRRRRPSDTPARTPRIPSPC